MLQTEGSKLQLQCKMGSDKVSIKEDPFAIYIGVFRRSSNSKMHMQTQSVGGNDNFWQTLDSNVVTTTLLIAVCPLKSRSPRVITASLKFSSLYVYKDIFSSPPLLNIQNQICFLIMALV